LCPCDFLTINKYTKQKFKNKCNICRTLIVDLQTAIGLEAEERKLILYYDMIHYIIRHGYHQANIHTQSIRGVEKSINMVYKKPNKMQAKEGRFSVLLVVIALSTGLLLSLTTILYNDQREATAQKQTQRASSSSSLSDVVTIQNTSMSVPAPNAAVNKQSMPHQIVVALPLRQDGKV
jgi:hypothetical protein